MLWPPSHWFCYLLWLNEPIQQCFPRGIQKWHHHFLPWATPIGRIILWSTQHSALQMEQWVLATATYGRRHQSSMPIITSICFVCCCTAPRPHWQTSPWMRSYTPCQWQWGWQWLRRHFTPAQICWRNLLMCLPSRLTLSLWKGSLPRHPPLDALWTHTRPEYWLHAIDHQFSPNLLYLILPWRAHFVLSCLLA